MVTLTPKAIDKVKALAQRDEEASVLRLAVQGGGCSGFQYAIGFDSEAVDGDLEVEQGGIRVVIDAVSLPYLEGSVLDYREGLVGAGFQFENPNVAATCGCNASFQARPEVQGPYTPAPGRGGCSI